MCSQNSRRCVGKALGQTFPLTYFCVVITGDFLIHATRETSEMMIAMATPKRLTLRSMWSIPNTTSRGATDGLRGCRWNRERFGDGSRMSGTDEGYNGEQKRVTSAGTRIVAPGA